MTNLNNIGHRNDKMITWKVKLRLKFERKVLHAIKQSESSIDDGLRFTKASSQTS